MEIKEILASVKRPERVVPLLLRGDLGAEWDRLEILFNQADTSITDDVLNTGRSSEAVEIAKEMEAVRAQMIKETALFHLQAVPRRLWKEMIARNAIDDEQAMANGQVNVDEEEFVTDMIRLCCTSPVMTKEEVEQLRDDLSDGQWQELANVAWDLNKSVLTPPFSLAAQTSAALGDITG